MGCRLRGCEGRARFLTAQAGRKTGLIALAFGVKSARALAHSTTLPRGFGVRPRCIGAALDAVFALSSSFPIGAHLEGVLPKW